MKPTATHVTAATAHMATATAVATAAVPAAVSKRRRSRTKATQKCRHRDQGPRRSFHRIAPLKVAPLGDT
jgi:hypothetical protein